jgi:hypothetical protein
MALTHTASLFKARANASEAKVASLESQLRAITSGKFEIALFFWRIVNLLDFSFTNGPLTRFI